MPEKPTITASELGILWLTYQEKTMILRMMEYFIEKADDEKAKEIMVNLYNELNSYVNKITDILRQEGAVIPIGFTNEDVNKNAPKLYENGFDIMFTRLIKAISMGLHSLNLTVAYREDIIILLKELTSFTQKYYHLCTVYLLEKGILARSPYVPMSQSVEFVKNHSYLSGAAMNPFHEKRPLNTIEVAHLYHAIESNILGQQIITGFAQCAKKKEVRNYFFEGAEIAKGIVKEVNELLLESNIQVPGSSGGNPSNSTEAPFSDKLMLYCTSLFCSFSMGGNSLGTAFSLRNDLTAKMTIFMKDIFEFAHKGAKIMIDNGWMEEPPQVPNRSEIVKE